MQAGENGEGLTRGLRGRRTADVADQRAVAGQEAGEVRHLLEIGGNVGRVALQMQIVELQMHHARDRAAARAQFARRRRAGPRHRQGHDAEPGAEQRRRKAGRDATRTHDATSLWFD